MTANRWILTDVDQGVFEQSWKENVAPGVTAEKRILRGGRQDGVETVSVTSDSFSFTVLPTRGMNIWKTWVDRFEFGWHSPARGPVHPAFVPLMEPSGLGWLDGFDEMFVRCGLESNGAPEHDPDSGQLKFPLHGKIANLPARKVEVLVDGDRITVRGIVEETRFHFMKMRMTSSVSWMRGSSRLEFHDEIRNLSASAHEVQMLYHINFGTPLLDGGSRFVAPVKTVVPRNDHAAQAIDGWENYQAPTAGYEEQVYFLELAGDSDGQTRTLLKNAHGTKGVSIEHNIKDLPCYTLWKNTTAEEDGYVTGLEPGTNFPNPRSFEGKKGRVISLEGNQTTGLRLAIDFLCSDQQVADIEKQIRKLTPTQTRIYDQPQKDWCFGVE